MSASEIINKPEFQENFNPNTCSSPFRKKKAIVDLKSPVHGPSGRCDSPKLSQSLLKVEYFEGDETLPLKDTTRSNVIVGKSKPAGTKRQRKKREVVDPQNQKTLYDYGVRRTQRQISKALKDNKEQDIIDCIKKGVQDGLRVFETVEKGRGIMASKHFKAGDFVVEYAGDLMKEKYAKLKEAVYKKDPSIGSYMFYFVHADKKWCVDATAESGKYGRLLNHSRLHPNCHVKTFVINGVPRLCILAKEDISPGTELLYDYGDRDKETLEIHPWLKL